MTRLMQSLMIAYVRYYNRKYGISGPLFAGAFRSRPLTTDKDLRWAIAYVHANHPSGPTYRYSSHNAYLDDHQRPGWLSRRDRAWLHSVARTSTPPSCEPTPPAPS